VLEAKGRYVGSRRCHDDGDEGDLVALDSACSMENKRGDSAVQCLQTCLSIVHDTAFDLSDQNLYIRSFR